jgi:hypothetical protein
MSVVDQVFFMLLDLLDSGFALVMPVVMAVFTATLGSAMIRIAFAWFAGSSENLIGGVIMLAIIFFTFFAIAFAAKGITDGAGRFALELGSGIVGADTMSPDDFGPSALWSIGDDQARLILDTKNALCTTTWECMKTIPEQLMLEFAALCIYAAFAFLLFEMAMTILSYKINSLFMLLFTPMAVLPFTKSFSEGAIQGTVNNLVKLTIVAMVAGVASQAFDLMEMPPKPVFDDIIPAMLLAIFVAFLAWQSRVLASGIISAVPQLSGQAVTSAIGNSMRAAVSGAGTGVVAATSAAMIGNREKASIVAAAKEIKQGAQRAPGRIAAAAAAAQDAATKAQSYWQNVRAANSNAGATQKPAGGGSASPVSQGGPKQQTAPSGQQNAPQKPPGSASPGSQGGPKQQTAPSGQQNAPQKPPGSASPGSQGGPKQQTAPSGQQNAPQKPPRKFQAGKGAHIGQEQGAANVTRENHGMSMGAKPDPNRNAPYETDWKERNPQEAAEVAERLARLKAGTWK